jgi:hypothetical protein
LFEPEGSVHVVIVHACNGGGRNTLFVGAWEVVLKLQLDGLVELVDASFHIFTAGCSQLEKLLATVSKLVKKLHLEDDVWDWMMSGRGIRILKNVRRQCQELKKYEVVDWGCDSMKMMSLSGGTWK